MKEGEKMSTELQMKRLIAFPLMMMELKEVEGVQAN